MGLEDRLGYIGSGNSLEVSTTGTAQAIYEDQGRPRSEYKVPDAIKKLGELPTHTDKLLTEIEDWGVIYFTTVFNNLKRLSPGGAAYRYLQTVWVYVSKKVK